jgi:23S rRNA pseudouridine1911/1915/1917 synthase
LIELIVPPDVGPQRLDVFLARRLPGASRDRVRDLIASGGVRVNGRRLPKGAPLRAGDVVRVADWSDPASAALTPIAALAIPILYEDADVLALNKPAGMPSHALRADETNTVANFLLARFPELRELARAVGKDDREPGLVHRLDTDTSGVLLVARTPPAYQDLRRQFAQRLVRKEYVALVDGIVAAPGVIDTSIAHDRRHRHRMQSSRSRGRPALTRYRPLRALRTRTLLAVEIPTGVMHQIRVHLALVGHPVAGDRVYGGSPAPRHLLHAERITFAHPTDGRMVRVQSPLPPDFVAEIKRAAGGQIARRTRPTNRRAARLPRQ